MDGCSNQLDLLAMEVRMLRRARYPITSYKVTAYSIGFGSGKWQKLEGLGESGLGVGQGHGVINRAWCYC